jgi:hypothetical protein
MVEFAPAEPCIPITVTRADGRGDEPAFEHERKGNLVRVSYLYTPYAGWVRKERVRVGR